MRTSSDLIILAAAEEWATLLERAVAVEAGALVDEDAHAALHEAISALYRAVRERGGWEGERPVTLPN